MSLAKLVVAKDSRDSMFNKAYLSTHKVSDFKLEVEKLKKLVPSLSSSALSCV